MPIEPIVESLENVDEALRGLYVEKGEGKFVLDVTPKGGYELANTEGLKSALGKERARAAELEGRTKAFGDLDPQDIKFKLQRLQELENIDPSKEADKLLEAKLKSIQEQMSAKHKAELQAKEELLGKNQNYLKKMLIDDAAKSAIVKAGGNERTLTYLLPHVINSLSIQETENGFITQVRDEYGNPRIGDSNGSAMTVEQLVIEMKGKDLWGPAFPGTDKSGGGMPSNTQGGTPTSNQKIDPSKMSPKEKSAFIAANPGKWMELISAKS